MTAVDWTQFNLACHRATEGAAAGEVHLVTLIERGLHGRALATAALVVAGAGGFTYLDPQRFSFEDFCEARAFVSGWTRYRIITRKGSTP
jgi:hypothetical protein